MVTQQRLSDPTPNPTHPTVRLAGAKRGEVLPLRPRVVLCQRPSSTTATTDEATHATVLIDSPSAVDVGSPCCSSTWRQPIPARTLETK